MSRKNDNNTVKVAEKNTINTTSFYLMKRCEKKLTATCKILNSKGKPEGTGFFCEIKLNKKLKKVLFTNNHVLNNYNSDIQIEYDRKIKILKKENRFFCTNEDLDYSCIEILDSDNFNNYFKVDKNINNDNPEEEYKYDRIVVIQYPGGNTPEFGEGYINEINKESIKYSIISDCGSSGSPICLDTRNLKVIGIHRGKVNNENTTLKRGIFMKEIIQDIEKQILSGGSTIQDKKQISSGGSSKLKINIDNKNENKYITITEENKSKIHQKFKPIGKSKDKNENKEYDLYTRKQFEENKRCW